MLFRRMPTVLDDDACAVRAHQKTTNPSTNTIIIIISIAQKHIPVLHSCTLKLKLMWPVYTHTIGNGTIHTSETQQSIGN